MGGSQKQRVGTLQLESNSEVSCLLLMLHTLSQIGILVVEQVKRRL